MNKQSEKKEASSAWAILVLLVLFMVILSVVAWLIGV